MVSKFRLAQVIADSSIRGIAPERVAWFLARYLEGHQQWLGCQLDDVSREPLLRVYAQGENAGDGRDAVPPGDSRRISNSESSSNRPSP